MLGSRQCYIATFVITVETLTLAALLLLFALKLYFAWCSFLIISPGREMERDGNCEAWVHLRRARLLPAESACHHLRLCLSMADGELRGRAANVCVSGDDFLCSFVPPLPLRCLSNGLHAHFQEWRTGTRYTSEIALERISCSTKNKLVKFITIFLETKKSNHRIFYANKYKMNSKRTDVDCAFYSMTTMSD